MRPLKDRLHRVVVLGATPSGIAAVNKLGELGIPVTLVESEADLDEKLSRDPFRLNTGTPFNFAHRPGLIRILRNPRITCILPARVEEIKRTPQGFSVHLTRLQTFVDAEKCILCGACEAICPVETDENGTKAVKYRGRFSLPGRPVIDKRRMPLCREKCPLGVNAQGYVTLAKAGKFEEALALIREKNILPGICGRICNHPCEDACRREQVDEPVSIRGIKRFLADYEALHPETIREPKPLEKRPETIAIIGSGPAGLAAAAQLARAGCQVRIYEKEEKAGGLLRYGIGAHRLPRAILDAELSYIEKMGVQFILSRHVNLGSDIPRFMEDHHALLVATGSWKDRRLGVPGEELEGVEGCLSFLTRFHREEMTAFHHGVAVIGDGNAAFDLARTLARLGAKVTLLSWFDQANIPADAHEVAGALEEGVVIADQTQVLAFEGENGVLKRLKCHPTRPGEPDKKGIAWPVLREESHPFFLDLDKAFIAIGQSGPEMPEEGMGINRFGYITVDEHHRTTLQGVYAAGDGVAGPSTVVQAMAEGVSAANSILLDLLGIGENPETRRPEEKEFPAIDTALPLKHRTPMPEKSAQKRRNNFLEVEKGLSQSDAMYEASRCLQCGVCSECLECLKACEEIGAIRHDEAEESWVEHAGVLIVADPELAMSVRGEEVIRAYVKKEATADVHEMVLRGFAAAAEAWMLLGGAYTVQKGHGVSLSPPDPSPSEGIRIGVFVCNCNRSLGWSPAFDEHVAGFSAIRDVVHTEVLKSACSREGVSAIVKQVRDKGITRIVLGSCVCCSLDFVCSACTDQRSRLKHMLFTATGISRSMVLTRNIRGEALSLFQKDPDQALDKFKGLLNRSVTLSRNLKPFKTPARNYNFAAAVIGASEAAVTAARTLAESGMDVFVFENSDADSKEWAGHPNIHCFFETSVEGISGALGDFRLDVKSRDLRQSVHVGTVILGERSRKEIGYIHQAGLPGRPVACGMQQKGVGGVPHFHPCMTSVPGLFVTHPPGIRLSNRQKGEAAALLAAAAMPRGPRRSKGYTVTIDKEVCRGCGRCASVCPFQAVTLKENGLGGWCAEVDEAFCKGCGNCISVCPSCAADSPYRNQDFFERTLEEILADAPLVEPLRRDP